jgi:para-nitrobenzyl esterase
MPRTRLSNLLARHWASAVALGITVVMTAGCSHHHAARAASSSFPLVVTTDRGAVRGVISADGQVANFLGIAYAAPPVGALRWRRPQPVAAWTGVRSADHYGPVCAQPASGDGPGSIREDCLYINVQRPAHGNTRQRLPVYLYIHGGGLTTGAGSNFSMAKIVRETGVIGVTFNYRLGVFGFLAHPRLTADQGEPGNYGFLDQQAALRWLRRNIAAFGGDPSRVTLGGESAGGWSVCAHLVSPGSRGLFAQAMIQSGSCQTETRDQADALGTSFAANVGCPDANPAQAVACLRALPTATLVHDENTFGFTSLLVRGTPALPHDPRNAIRNGDFSHVPVLIGGTLNEGRAFTSTNSGWTQSDYERWVQSMFGANAGVVLQQYPWPANADQFAPAYLTGAILTDAGIIGPANPPIEAGIGGCGTQALVKDLARHTTVYAYEWAPRHGPGIVQSRGYANGAGHASELAYLWPNFTENGVRISSLFTRDERQLSNQIVDYWGAFVKTGAPRAAGQPSWPRYTATSAIELSLRAEGQSRPLDSSIISTEHHCSLWDKLTKN